MTMRALITGASSGFGAEYARQLAAKGYDLILAARRTEKLEALGKELENKYGIKTESFTVDLSNMDGINNICNKIIDQRDIDLIINNAGMGNPTPLLETSTQFIEQMMTLNMTSVVLLTQRMINKWLSTTRKGKIINVSSTSSFLFDGVWPLYAASKAFVRSISYGFDSTLEDIDNHDIKMQILCPSFTKTNFVGMGEHYTEETLNKMGFMEASDVVKESLDALSTGQVLVLPGNLSKDNIKEFESTTIEQQRKKHKDFVKAFGLKF